MKLPILPGLALQHPGTIRILLGKEASEAIAANGDYHLAAITHPDHTDPPETLGRLVVLCVPTSKALLDDAARVILGTHRAVKIKPATKSTPPATPPTA
jgi:hypothetical protein